MKSKYTTSKHNGQEVSGPQKTIKLTPRLFSKLDIITRTEAGCPLGVEEHKELKGNFACIPIMALPVYIDTNKTGYGSITEVTIIEIANQIDVERFRNTSRPVNWSKIPKNKIYLFLIYHEIGHILFTFREILLPYDFLMNREKRKLFHMANELQVDQYAWKRLFPEQPVPIRKGYEEQIKEIEIFMKAHKEYFSPEPTRKPKPISTNPNEMVPKSHAEKGIPWATGRGKPLILPEEDKEEGLIGHISLPQLNNIPPDAYGSIVKGNNMKHPYSDGIMNGDMVIIIPAVEIGHGDIVVVETDLDKRVLRRYNAQAKFLTSDNHLSDNPIYDSDDLENKTCQIIGKVIGLLRIFK